MSEPIVLIQPSAGAILTVGSSYDITWTSDGSCGNQFEIHLFKNYVWQKTIVATSDTGSYTWNIPSDLVPGTDYSIKIEKVGDYTCGNSDTWIRTFEIKSSGGNGGCISTGIYICESGQTGYEVDNCGDRKANLICGKPSVSCGIDQIKLFGSCYNKNGMYMVGVGVGIVLLISMFKK